MRTKKSCIYFYRKRKLFIYCQCARLSFISHEHREKWYKSHCFLSGESCPLKKTLDLVIKEDTPDLCGVNYFEN